MILNRIISIYGISFDGFPWESYFLASIPDLLHQKVYTIIHMTAPDRACWEAILLKFVSK
jgi:hypothetical protein